jgi:hypothetical protein
LTGSFFGGACFLPLVGDLDFDADLFFAAGLARVTAWVAGGCFFTPVIFLSFLPDLMIYV